MNFLNEVKRRIFYLFIRFCLLVETSEGDSLLLAVIEAYCVLTSNNDTPTSKTQRTFDHSNIRLSPTTSIDM
jgi:hypothetical protein